MDLLGTLIYYVKYIGYLFGYLSYDISIVF